MITDRPVGTLTFLFTDVQGSTRLWESDPAGMAEALAWHDATLRDVLSRHGGEVFKTVGDAFCAAFLTPADALRAAGEAQRALHDGPWPGALRLQVRMALHAGPVQARDGDYFGPTLNRVARLLALGHGGQVLTSRVVRDLGSDGLADEAEWRSLGAHDLRDLARPEEVFQLVLPGLPSTFPPMKSGIARRHVPVSATSFVGRERELEAVGRLLLSTRFVSLTGTGGCGKTRLALEAASRFEESSDVSVRVVELAALSDPDLVPATTAEAVGATANDTLPPLERLVRHFGGGAWLIVLDNCEHLVDACRALVHRLLAACPGLRVLATTREALGVPGETTLRVPSLALPGFDANPTEMIACESVRLFRDRGAQVRDDFQVTVANAKSVASICRRLDGIPLALELAAARLRSLSAEEIDARLDQRFRLLTGGSRTALPRQQTLRALVDWSFNLLGPRERTLLTHLAVFAGGWDLETAQAVVGEGADDLDVLDGLDSLVDKSLVMAESGERTTRFGLLETVRQYAAELLEETEDGGEELRRRHAEACLELALAAAPDLRQGMVGSPRVARFDAHRENVRAALDWCHATGDAPRLFRLVCAVAPYWTRRGQYHEAERWFDRILADAPDAGSDLACALREASVVSRALGQYARAEAQAERALEVARERKDVAGEAEALGTLAACVGESGDLVRACALLESSAQVAAQAGDRRTLATARLNLSLFSRNLGDLETSERAARESAELSRAEGNGLRLALALNLLGDLALARADRAEARAHYAESYALFFQLDALRPIALSLEDYALDLTQSDQPEALRAAATLLACTGRMRREMAIPMPAFMAAKGQAGRARLESALGPEAATEADRRGGALAPPEAVALLLSTLD